ncbi:MAG: apolipoprotein N-acyltransferase [Planctomycetota bacterium]|jgi:apolipoprotein N-acyltransferase
MSERINGFTHKHIYASTTLPFVASAAMLTVIQAPMNLSVLAWIAFVPFIIVCCRQTRPRRLFLIAYLISLLYWMGNLYWIFPVTIVGGITVCLYTALLWPVLAFCLRYCRAKKVPLFLASAVLIVGVERMQGLFLGGFFWRFLAHSQYQNITIIQIADIFGAGGVSFLVAMVNGLLAELILTAVSCQPRRSEGSDLPPLTTRFFASLRMTNLLQVAVVFAVVAAAVVYGRWRIGQEDQFVEVGPLVASLQSNVPQSVKRTFESGDDLFNGLLEDSKAASAAGAELIVWPETMVQAMLDTDVWPYLVSPESSRALDGALREHAKDNAFLLVGAYGTEIQQKGAERYLARYNSAFFYRPDGSKHDQRYDKIHLVPFGEVLPLRRSLSWFYELLMKIKFIPYNFDYSLDYGTKYTVFEMTGSPDRDSAPDGSTTQTPAYKFGVIICYEGTVPAIAREFALDEQGRKRLDWIVNISNDGWFVRFKDDKVTPSTELGQHAAICAFRAVENRLAVVRSVNTGISCLIDSMGRIRDGYAEGTLPSEAMSRMGMTGWFIDRIPIDSRTTFFSKYGEWLDYCCEVCVILLIIAPLSVKFFRTREWKTRLSRWSNEKPIRKRQGTKA